jgi:4-hydroxyphenylpyruvate dioxygenase
MRTSIATVSISGDLREKLAAIAVAGFDGVEIFENDFLTFDGTPRDVGAMVRDFGLAITVYQPFRDFEGTPDAQRAATFDRAERKFDLMAELGTDLMLVCSNVSPGALGGIDRAAADFHELGERAKKRNLKVGYEALAWGRFVNDHRDAWEIVRRADHPNIGLMVDSFHTLARGLDPDSIRSVPKDRIFLVQLADAPAVKMDYLSWSRHLRMMPGQGDLDVVGFMGAVASTGYDGVISIEVFNDQFRGGSPKSIAVDGHRSLVYLMEQVRRREPALAATAPQLPPRTQVEGVEFVELAANEAEAEELAAILRTMGFRKSGRHRSKDVTLFRQGNAKNGGINIVINTEREGLSHSSYVMHGTSAYAVGLRVDDALATVVRARGLGARPFEQPPGPGEIAIPAIRGVGGGVLYFIDRSKRLEHIWEDEFVLAQETNQEAGGDAGLASFDHVAQTMNYAEMLTWILFYTSIFEVGKSPMVDIVDPAGLVRSQVIENASGALRLTLNGAENRNTLAGHFMAETFGSNVQHLAFASSDIFASSDAMRKSGFKRLAISPNYFDDIAARFALSADLVEKLKAGDILYDRDAGGEYFQFYSQNYGEGFFFEIVERRGDYKGYGAPNAPFRIAAQKRQIKSSAM